jgi:hypothetical protein
MRDIAVESPKLSSSGLAES